MAEQRRNSQNRQSNTRKNTTGSSRKNSSGSSGKSRSSQGSSGKSRSSQSGSGKSRSTQSSSGTSRSTQNTSRASSGKKSNQSRNITRDIFLLGMLLVCVLLFIANFGAGGAVGNAISGFFFGLWGTLEYVFPVLLLAACFFACSNQKNSVARVKLLFSVLAMIFLCALLQLISNSAGVIPIKETGIGENFLKCYDHTFGGGLFAGIIAKLFVNWFGDVAPYFIVIILFVICMVMVTGQSFFLGVKNGGKRIGDRVAGDFEDYRQETEQKKWEREDRRNRKKNMSRSNQKLRGTTLDTEITETEEASFGTGLGSEDVHEIRSDASVGNNEESESKSSDRYYSFTREEKPSEEKTASVTHKEEEQKDLIFEQVEKKPEKDDSLPTFSFSEELLHYEEEQSNVSSTEVEEYDFEPGMLSSTITTRKHKDYMKPGNTYDGKEDGWEEVTTKVEGIPSSTATFEKNLDPGFTLSDAEADADAYAYEYEEPEITKSSLETDSEIPLAVEEQHIPARTPVKKPKAYRFPPLTLLKRSDNTKEGNGDEDLRETAKKLDSILGIYGVDAHVVGYARGPAVTRYELEPRLGVKVNKVVSLSDEIKLGLAATNIRIEAPVPGTSYIGIEVPNKQASSVFLADLISRPDFKNHKSKLAFAAGKDISGNVVVGDIAKMPHLLIAGTTGSGKSVCINSIILSILYHATPEDVRLLMVDPKRVELTEYNGIPHLLSPVITDAKKAAAMLNWVVKEMMDRYDLFVAAGVKEIHSYNEKVALVEQQNPGAQNPKKLTQMVVIIDELADLMMVAAKEVEESIVRIAQLARAAGIHLILATQTPRADVVTGLIKANVPSKIAFAVSSGLESRIVLDAMGAETLLGKGDMLYLPMGMNKALRAQGAFVSEEEIHAVVERVKADNSEPEYNEQVEESISNPNAVTISNSSGNSNENPDQDEFLIKAGYMIIEKQRASIGTLQRMYRIGFNRAARIMDSLFEMGVVGADEGTKPRKILMTKEEFDAYLQEHS